MKIIPRQNFCRSIVLALFDNTIAYILIAIQVGDHDGGPVGVKLRTANEV